MSKKKKAPQHAKKSRLRQRFERRLTKENDTGAWQQEDEAVGRAAAGEFDTMSFDAPEEGGSYGEGPYEGAPSVSDDTMDFDMPEDAGGYGPQYGYGGEAYEAPVSASDDTMDFDVPEDAGSYGPQYGYGDEAYEAPSSVSDDTMDFDVPGDGARGPQYGYDDEPYEAPYSAADDTMGFEPPDGGTGGYGGGDGGYSGQPPRGGRHGKDGFFQKYLSGHGLAVALSAAGVVLVGVLGVVAAFKFGLLGTGGLPASSPAPSGSTGISGAVPGSSSSQLRPRPAAGRQSHKAAPQRQRLHRGPAQRPGPRLPQERRLRPLPHRRERPRRSPRLRRKKPARPRPIPTAG